MHRLVQPSLQSSTIVFFRNVEISTSDNIWLVRVSLLFVRLRLQTYWTCSEPFKANLREKTHVKYHKRNVCPKQEEAWKHGLSQRLRRNHPRWIFKRGVDRFRGRIYTGHVSRFTNRISIPLLFELRATTSATSNFADSVWLSFRYCGALP